MTDNTAATIPPELEALLTLNVDGAQVFMPNLPPDKRLEHGRLLLRLLAAKREAPAATDEPEVFTIERGPSIYMDSTGDFYIRRPDRPGVLATAVLPLDWKDRGR